MRALPVLLLSAAACTAAGGADESKAAPAAADSTTAAVSSFAGKPSDKPTAAAPDSGPGEAARATPIPESELGEFTPVQETGGHLEEIRPASSTPAKPVRSKP